MSKAAGQFSTSLVENDVFLDLRSATIEPCSIDSTAVDSTNSPTTQLRRGLVVGYDGAGLNFVDAADSTVDAHTFGAITSAEAPDSDWNGTTLTVEEVGVGKIAYVVGGVGAVSNLATMLVDVNQGPLGALVVGSNNGSGLLTLTAIRPGVVLSVTSSLSTAYAAGAGVETTNAGALNKYGILLTPIASMLGISDSAEDKNASIVTANARVKSAGLLGMTTAARQWFDANNILIVS